MEIIFDKKIARHINSSKARQKKFGALASPIGRRLDDLVALENLDEARGIPGRFEALTEDRHGKYSLRLSGNWRLVFEPANDPIPTLEDGGIDLEKVTAIRILEVVDYH
ncbi:MAG: killer suppression protein [Candidatus Sumerlaeia bacterium]|nr:killer suppression protein [Candidatus Sumerlaeia bacterium]